MNRTVLLSLLAVATTAGFAQSSATASSSVGARILCKIQVANNQGLEFGTIVADSSAQTVTVSAAAAATRSTTGTAGNLLTGGGPVAAAFEAAKFTVTGCGGKSYSVTLPGSTTINDGGTNNMTVNNYTKSTLGTLGTSPFTSGTDVFYVGADLGVGANQAAGNYTGTFSVTVQYL
jgi:hypothetical protein